MFAADMRSRPCLPRVAGALLAAASLVVTPLRGAVTDSQPVDTNALLEALKTLRKKQEESLGSVRGRILQAIQSASGSTSAAWELYQEAIKAVQFEGQEKEGTKFRDWKKKEEERLDDPDFRNAIPVHLAYLALTLRKASGAETEELLPALMRHAAAVSAAEASWGGDKQMMLRPITESVFVKHFGIDAWIAGVKEWELVPANVDGMYEKTVLPELRRQKNPQVVDYWDARIRREAEKVGQVRLAFQTERFEAVTKPGLLWKRAQEFRHIGLPNRALNEMFAVLKAYPSHPDFDRWASELEQLISPKPEGEAVVPTGGTALPAGAATPPGT